MGRPSPSNLHHHLMHGSLVHLSPQPKGISIGSAVFVGLTIVTDRPRDRQTTLHR